MSIVFPMGLLMLISGIKYPVVTSYLAAAFTFSRVGQLVGPNKFASASTAMSIFQIIGFWAGTVAMFGLIYYSYYSCEELKAQLLPIPTPAAATANATAGADL